MGVWKVKIITSKRKKTEDFQSDVTTALNDDWTIIGYSVDDGFQYALLSKKSK